MARFTNPDYFESSCYSYEVKPDQVFIVIDPKRQDDEPVTFEIPIDEIQPTESFLIKSEVDFYLKNPPQLYLPTAPIIIMKSADYRFKYFTRTGDCQLYTLYFIGADSVTVAPFCQPLIELIPHPHHQLRLAQESYREGVRELSNFDNRLVNEEEYERIMTMRFTRKNH